MLRACVKRDQFNVSAYGIVHMPTDATFTPDYGDPNSGTIRVGHLNSRQPNDGGFKPDEMSFGLNTLPTTLSFSDALAKSLISGLVGFVAAAGRLFSLPPSLPRCRKCPPG
jgi:hypothetical protein